jgi:hypothetical protein
MNLDAVESESEAWLGTDALLQDLTPGVPGKVDRTALPRRMRARK